MPTFLELPNEIISVVIKFIYQDNNNDDLLRLCLTSKVLLALAQPFLFRDIKLQVTIPRGRASLSRLDSLYQALSIDNTLGRFVRCFQIELEGDRGYHAFAQDDGSSLIYRKLCDVMAFLPLLRELCIVHTPVSYPWDWHSTLSILEKLQALEKLELRNSFVIDNFKLLQTLQKLTLLKSLKLYSARPRLRTQEMNRRPSYNLSLKSLRQLHFGVNSADIIDFLPHCVALEDLSLYFQDSSVSTLQNIITPLSSTLQALHITCSDRIGNIGQKLSLHHLSFIQKLSQLEIFSILDWMIYPDDSPKDFFDVLLSGASYKLVWIYSECIFEQQQLIRPMISLMKDAFRYGSTQSLGVKSFHLELMSRSGENNLTGITHKLATLQANLTAMGVIAGCYLSST
jgi:hypothetical protein